MILRNVRPKRGADTIDLTGLTAAQRTGEAYWHPDELDTLVMPLDREPTPAEAKAIRRRLVTEDAADEAHLSELLKGHRDPGAPAWARATLAAEIGHYGEPSDLT